MTDFTYQPIYQRHLPSQHSHHELDLQKMVSAALNLECILSTFARCTPCGAACVGSVLPAIGAGHMAKLSSCAYTISLHEVLARGNALADAD